jgi:hypothetical protein
LEVLAVERERFARHEPREHLKALIEAGGARLQIHGLAHLVEPAVIFGRAHTRSEDDASLRQVVQRDRFLHQLPGTPSRNGGEHRAEDDSLGAGRHRAHQDPGVEERKGGEVFRLDSDGVRDEEPVPAVLLGGDGDVDDALGGLGGVQNEAVPERHAGWFIRVRRFPLL